MKTQLAMLAAAFLAVAGPGDAAELRYGTATPDAAPLHKDVVVPVLKSIEKDTAGAVTFAIFPGGQLINFKTALKGIRDGIVDAGFVGFSLAADDMPHASMVATMLPFSIDPLAATGAFNDLMLVSCKECIEDLKKNGVVHVFGGAGAPYYLACKPAVKSVADLKGLKIGTVNPTLSRWAEALGMAPTKVDLTEFAQALQFGRIDCATVPMAWMKDYGLTNIVKSVVDQPAGVPIGASALMVNGGKWEKISKKDRQTIMRLGPAGDFAFPTVGFLDSDKQVRRQAEAKGIAFVKVADVATAWRAFQKSETPAIVKVAAGRGIKDPEAFVDRMIAVIEKWHVKLKPEFGDDREKFIAVLQREVYDRIPQ